jgi:GAF domain-containing protein
VIPRPANETVRISAVKRCGLLDTPPEEDFTFLTELAAAVCGAPLAFVTLVDEERVWYKAWHGVEAKSIQCARDDGYCSWAVLEQDLLHIPDLTRDGRSATISTTAGGPHYRMYCGANLLTPDGLPLGTLCVVDTVPRELSGEQQRLMTKLARQVIALIELRAKQAELQAAVGEMKRLATSVLP